MPKLHDDDSIVFDRDGAESQAVQGDNLSGSPTVVLVDTYESADHGVPQSARHIAPAFHTAGAQCIRVQSAADSPGVYRSSTPALEHYVENVVHDGDLENT
ncbi:MAG TPA: hypothetical protein VGO80_22870 [Solirubrobacteraceae bacterium]|jgi:hypothetical protein|nr:hypothetical protein [Solirubrobacteraceae bacterium]